ncbi:MAG: hypothetical protein JRH19_25625 [Deltaproteobacteria bacterium]|nr:hypothetical protein [Deltaproteobacteria bacterium]
MPTRRPGRGAARRFLLAFLLCSAALLLACGCEPRPEARAEQPSSLAELPEGALMAGDAAALGRLLARLEGLEGTPVARMAREMGERLAHCQEFSARAAAGSVADLARGLRCEAFADQPAAVRALRGDGDDWVFVLPVGDGGRVAGALRTDAQGAVEIVAQLEPPEGSAMATLILPGAEAPGAPTLSGDQGLDIASLIPEDSQADRLFRLKSELFLGSVLGKSWELGVYMPASGSVTPPMALAVDISVRAGAVVAMKRFVADLEATWPVHHVPASIAGFPGACFPDLRILPEFAPCYVATAHSLVIGWNAASVDKALASVKPGGALPGRRSGLVLHLDRLPEADRRLREALGSEGPQHSTGPQRSTDYIWDRLVLESARGKQGYELRARLEAPAAS